jgi:hypothetical protein
MQPLVSVSGLTKTYRDIVALSAVATFFIWPTRSRRGHPKRWGGRPRSTSREET